VLTHRTTRASVVLTLTTLVVMAGMWGIVRRLVEPRGPAGAASAESEGR
jgi:hypothetical protein